MSEDRSAPADSADADPEAVIGIARRPRVRLRDQAIVMARGLLPMTSSAEQYVIYAQGRSGSTLLGSLLASHPQVRFADEILYRPVTDPRLWVRGLRWVDRGLVWGFHVKSYQLTIQQQVTQPERWLHRMVDDGWTIIHLERLDVVRQAVSNAVAAARATFHARDGEVLGDHPPSVDAAAFVEVVRRRLRTLQEDRTAVAGVPHERVVYERDLRDASRHQATAARLFDALGVEPAPVSTGLRRTSTQPWDDVANWDELVAALDAAGLSHHLATDS